jgi:starch synthase (maltosyl-transferring)
LAPGKEEYLNSEKYEFYKWDWDRHNKITTVISRINKIRNEHASLQQTNNIIFCATNNEKVMAYYKFDDEKQDETLMIASLDSNNTAQSMVQLPGDLLGKLPIKITDLITGNTYIWDKEWNFVVISPDLPFHLFKIQP